MTNSDPTGQWWWPLLVGGASYIVGKLVWIGAEAGINFLRSEAAKKKADARKTATAEDDNEADRFDRMVEAVAKAIEEKKK